MTPFLLSAFSLSSLPLWSVSHGCLPRGPSQKLVVLDSRLHIIHSRLLVHQVPTSRAEIGRDPTMLLLSLDPPSVPSPVRVGLEWVQWATEGFGWTVVLALLVSLLARHLFLEWHRRRGSQVDPVHAAEVRGRVQEAREKQQLAWETVAPSVRRGAVAQAAAARRQQEQATDLANEAADEHDRLYDDLDGIARQRRRKNPWAAASGRGDGSSGSSAPQSGFKPYQKPQPTSGATRRFGTSGPKCGGGGCGRK